MEPEETIETDLGLPASLESELIPDTHQESRSNLFSSKALIELCSRSWSQSKLDDLQSYLRGCKWSPDGTCCLSVINNDGVHVTELPRSLYDGGVEQNRPIDILSSVIHVKEAGLIYDFCWYPMMNSSYPETCFWITTRHNAPIQMWDAFDGTLKCSYRGFNAVDEMEPALSVTFTPDGSKIIAGYKKVLRTFNVCRPGRDFVEHKIKSPASCFAADSNIVAVGSWNTSISLYNISEMGTYKSIGKMHGHSGGVTHMKFSQNGSILVSGARKDHRLLVWDLRYYSRPLNILNRVADTNQRVYFDVSPCGKYLATGGSDGILKVWDMNKLDWTSRLDPIDPCYDSVTYKFLLHQDCCNSVSFNPFRPIIATGSGQYHFKDPAASLDDEESQLNHIVENNIEEDSNTIDMKYSSNTDNSLVFWWIGDIPELI